MNFLVDQLRLLGLNDKETRVFTALATFGRMNMTKLAARSGLARTTVDAIVRRLCTQGLFVREKVRGHYEYRVVLPELVGRLDVLRTKLQPDTEAAENPTVAARTAEVAKAQAHSFDLDGLLEKYTGDRVRGLIVRTEQNAQATLERFVALQAVAARHALRLETLVCRALLRNNKEALRERLQGVVLSGQFAHVVPEAYCAGAHDMLVMRDSGILLDPVQGSITHVQDGDVVRSMNHLFAMASETGWRVDLADWIT